MRRLTLSVTLAVLLSATPEAAPAQYDYHQPTQQLVTLGTQALMICNGLFVSERSLDLIYEQELRLDRMPVLPPSQVSTPSTGGGE